MGNFAPILPELHYLPGDRFLRRWLAGEPAQLRDNAPPTRTASRNETPVDTPLPVGFKTTDFNRLSLFQQMPIRMTATIATNKIKTIHGEGRPSSDHGLAYCLVAFDVSISQIIDTGDGIFVCVPDR